MGGCRRLLLIVTLVLAAALTAVPGAKPVPAHGAAVFKLAGCKKVRKTIHGKTRTVTVCHPAKTKPAPTPTPAGSLHLATITFYEQGDHVTCQGTTPTTSYPSTAAQAFVAITATGWYGAHSVRFDWSGPRGIVYSLKVGPLTANGPARTCAWFNIAGHEPAFERGEWTVQVNVDSRRIGSGSFLVSG